MPEVPKRLGRGLDAILDSLGAPEESSVSSLSVSPNDIRPNPFQPRKDFDSDKAVQAFEDLKASIKSKGLIQPITVREVNGEYELIAGERRLRACQELGLETIPIHILTVDKDVDMMELALIENLQRDNLNPLEEAEAYSLLSEKYDLSHEEIAGNIGKSRAAITNAMRLLKLPAEIKVALKNLVISAGHARALLGLDSEKEMVHIFQLVRRNNMSVRETENYVKKLKEKTPVSAKKKKTPPKKSVFLTRSEEALMTVLGTRVQIKAGPKKGIIEVEYFGDEDLERLLELFGSLKK
ncbi:MAG: ParB/RepB/Spo0J family partition protein [Candidatus Marinimicrobia bacterium]|jgi:ParB family transcriptional regulator, chromosome partitioning protein|nr:ParB/RepB/Spo0J family partition protein [Candidatus Neomarinimicrobiota bacterium]MBT4360271.1 ParB/RepB/Spo0J family partition protein [Candidatus Neomarinimicrobiota bacterium]MBT4715703.1 ParB/RepB/Spo0J family partition protein [Candidatus Neomarinimicrobiota bacterium]MBT4947879.1 ParB/RepB/Spo0J family partition protein [Candidatus Neomarinimicrobiota bacterium]MBT5267982.1 ParB/RepB/Spo0J family partition protein [Candidatus Neomarinimicrobiota bacterium]